MIKLIYKRDEAFRFEFGEPIPLTFTIDEVDGSVVDSSDGQAQMLDLSLSGMKLVMDLEIPVQQKEVKLSTRFTMNENEYTVTGKLVWIEKVISEFHYGMQFSLDEETQDQLLNDLKVIGKEMAKE